MPTPDALYPLLLPWLHALGGPSHATARLALAHLVTALLLGQSLRPSALMRALWSPTPVPARQRYQRVARAWDRPWLTSAGLTPLLVRAARALVAPDGPGWPTAGLTHVVLDSVRCGRWEIFTLGVVWHGRMLPVGWAVLPYPWPKRQFTPTVCALVRAVAAAWPAERPAHLLADRAFPSAPLFRTLRACGWGWTVRLRASDTVRCADQPQPVRARLATAAPERWQLTPATYGRRQQRVAGAVVVGRGLRVLPWHQSNPGSLRHRARQQAKRQQHLATKHRGQPDRSAETDAWVVLFTSHTTWRGAVSSYRRRWATEGSYRDAQGGWDGQHGWDLEGVVARLPQAARVERVVGLWALGTLVQTWVGHELSYAGAAEQAVLGQWTTTGRLSVWARGRLALTDPSGALREWLPATLCEGAQRVALGPRAGAPPLGATRPQQEAA
jgi:hypothetical protein